MTPSWTYTPHKSAYARSEKTSSIWRIGSLITHPSWPIHTKGANATTAIPTRTSPIVRPQEDCQCSTMDFLESMADGWHQDGGARFVWQGVWNRPVWWTEDKRLSCLSERGDTWSHRHPLHHTWLESEETQRLAATARWRSSFPALAEEIIAAK